MHLFFFLKKTNSSDDLERFMENQGATSPGVLILTTSLSKPFMRLEKYVTLLQELERHMEVRENKFQQGPLPTGVLCAAQSTCSASKPALLWIQKTSWFPMLLDLIFRLPQRSPNFPLYATTDDPPFFPTAQLSLLPSSLISSRSQPCCFPQDYAHCLT